MSKKKKRVRRELLKEIGLSVTQFKRKMPKVKTVTVDTEGKVVASFRGPTREESMSGFQRSFEVITSKDKMKGHFGRKMSLSEQLVWLNELRYATAELREELRKNAEEAEKEKTQELEIVKLEEPTFKVEK